MSSDKIFLSGEGPFRAAEHSLAFSRHCRAGQGIEGVSVDGRKGRNFTDPSLNWVERGVGVFKLYRRASYIFNEFIPFGIAVLCSDPISEPSAYSDAFANGRFSLCPYIRPHSVRLLIFTEFQFWLLL
jgi:hypothetical protein